jgi:hypothetical protein
MVEDESNNYKAEKLPMYQVPVILERAGPVP